MVVEGKMVVVGLGAVMAGIRGVTLGRQGSLSGLLEVSLGPTRRNTDESRFPPDDPNDMLVSAAHWSMGIIGIRRFFIRY